MSLLKNLLYKLAYRILEPEIYRETGEYEIRNCMHGFECHLRGNIDDKVKVKRLFPDLDDKKLTYLEASCGLCGMGIRVENKWDQIQTDLYMNRAFIVNRNELEPEEWVENRRKMREKIGEPCVTYPLKPLPDEVPKFSEGLTGADKIFEEIRLALINSHSGEGYGDQRKAAEIAVKNFGDDWTNKFPKTEEGEAIRPILRKLVKETTPEWHSNHYVVWQRLQDRAKEIAD